MANFCYNARSIYIYKNDGINTNVAKLNSIMYRNVNINIDH